MNPGSLARKEAKYVRLLQSNGIDSTVGDTCNLANSAYSVLIPIMKSEMTLDALEDDIMRQSGLSRAQAAYIMQSVFDSFGFPPTCDLAPNRMC